MHAAYAAILKADVGATMAITIRNKQLEAEIKAIGAKYRKGPTQTVRFLLREHIMREPVDEHASAAEREGKIAELRAASKACNQNAPRRAKLMGNPLRICAKPSPRPIYAALEQAA